MARFFDVSKPGKGVSKEDANKKQGVALFFEIYLKRFWKLCFLNLLYIIASVPAIYISSQLSMYVVSIFADKLMGLRLGDEAVMMQLFPVMILLFIYHIHFFGSGPATAGVNYVLKKFVNDTHAWVWSDFIKGFRENIRQALCMYIINFVISSASMISYIYYSATLAPPMQHIVRILILAALIIFTLMQLYTYQLMIGFKLTVKEIYKNSFIFVVINLPRNILAVFAGAGIIYVVFNVIAIAPGAVSYFAVVVMFTLLYALSPMAQMFITKGCIDKYMLGEKAEDNKEENSDRDFSDEIKK